MRSTMEQAFNRAIEFTGAYSNHRVAPEMVDSLALASLSADDAMHKMQAFALWCYQKDDQDRLLHILPNGQIPSGSWTPWGSSGKGPLTRQSRDILRRWLYTLRERRYFPPWFYYPEQRRWYVDLRRYDDLKDTLDWLTKNPINPKDWLNLYISLKRGNV